MDMPSVLGTIIVVFMSLTNVPSTATNTSEFDTKPFHIIWQMPSGIWCSNSTINIPYDAILKNTGITYNAEDRWNVGDYSTVLYRHTFGSWPHYLNGEEPPINGGLPQLGNLEAHLEGARQATERDIPNKDYNGIACINMEQFRPLYRKNFGRKKEIYQTKSVELASTNIGDNITIGQAAVQQFEHHARAFMEGTLLAATTIRPNGKWGYYNYPYCYNGNVPISLHCRADVQTSNTEMRWLWEASSAIMPSTYVHTESHNDYEAAKFMYGNIEEGRRVADLVGGRPVFSYHKTKWNMTLPVPFYREVTMLNGLRLPSDFGIEGVIIWGSSNDFRSVYDCQRSYDYVRDVVAPYSTKLVEFTKLCSQTKCSGQGRCVHRGTLEEKYADEVLRTTVEQLNDWIIDERYSSCRCYEGRSGHDCRVESSADRITFTAWILLLTELFGLLSWANFARD